MHVLVVEDDAKIAEFIRRGLEAEGHHAEVTRDGVSGLKLASSGRHDLVLLDLALPGMDGTEVLRRIRACQPSLSVIAVTARGSVEDRVHGLDLGADDYLVKPFSFVELTARIRALFRRSQSAADPILRVADLRLHRVERVLELGGERVELSTREAQLLEYFMHNADTPLTRAMIADRVWGHQFDTGTNVIDVYVNYVRKKLHTLGADPIRTIRGVGYVFEPDSLPARAAAS